MRLPTPKTILNLFKSRTDIYAKRWVNQAGRSGYSPDCKNLFHPTLCRKTVKGGRCDGCPAKEYLPLTENVVDLHLKGKATIGIYPLLEDNTTWFLAVDFDDHSSGPDKKPLDDAKAFRDVCKANDIPCYIEISRSGNGAHTWVFFSESIPAWIARRAFMAIAMEAGLINQNPDKKTFDRFFPNQDKHKGRGFGNLIALPYSGKSRFLDADTETKDQVTILEGIKKVSVDELLNLKSLADKHKVQWDEERMFETEDTGINHTDSKQKAARTLTCDFIKWCQENPDQVTEPLWYAMITNLAGFEDGNKHIHKISALDTERYTKEDTDIKIEQALETLDEFGPHTCQYICDNGFPCPRLGTCQVNAPAGLSYIQSKVFISYGCYYRRTKDGAIKISNFTMRLKHTFLADEGALREVILVNDIGQESAPMLLSPAEMANLTKFREFCFAAGNYSFDGNTSDINEICRLLFAQAQDFVEMPRIVGLYKDMWIFSNGILDSKGNINYMDDDGIAWIDGKGYKPVPLDGTEGNDILPEIYPPEPITSEDIKIVLDTFLQNVGHYGIFLAIGWIVACFHSVEIFEKYKCFPFKFLAGKRGSGKSSIAALLLRLFGWDADPSQGKNFGTTSIVAFNRMLEHRSSIPVWADEYRNDRACRMKDGLLRGVYNRASTAKGQIMSGIRSNRIRGTLLLCGEHTPQDSGLLTRCVITHILENHRDDEAFLKLQGMGSKMRAIGLEILKSKIHLGSDALLTHVETWFEDLKDKGLDARQAINYAICAGSMEACFGNFFDRQAFFDWTVIETLEDKEIKDTEHPSIQFLEDVAYMAETGELTENETYRIIDDKLYIYMAFVYKAWERFYKGQGRGDPMKKNDLIQDLRTWDFISPEWSNQRLNGKPRSCLVVSLEHKNTPNELKNMGGEDEKLDF